MCTRSLSQPSPGHATDSGLYKCHTPSELFVCCCCLPPLPSTAGQRSTIEKLVVLLGGSFCKTLGRHQRPTHLMLPSWGPDSAAAAGRADPADAAPAVDGQGTADGTGVGSASQQQQQLLPESTVKKIAYAMKHRVEMVVSEWLLDCAAEGRRVQEGLHRPEGDLSLLELPAGGCGATQAGGGGATQLLPATQLPQTQQQTQVSNCSCWALLPACLAPGAAAISACILSTCTVFDLCLTCMSPLHCASRPQHPAAGCLFHPAAGRRCTRQQAAAPCTSRHALACVAAVRSSPPATASPLRQQDRSSSSSHNNSTKQQHSSGACGSSGRRQ